MSDDTLDTLDLDMMIRGQEDDPKKWEALLRAPDANRVWEDAMDRRSSVLDAMDRVGDREWLARALLALKRAGRQLGRITRDAPRATIYHSLAPSPVGAMLGDARAGGFRLVWGELIEVTLEVGHQLAIDHEDNVHLYYLDEDHYVEFTTGAWDLGEDEAPVLILALEIGAHSSPEIALEQGAPFAHVLIVEALSEQAK